MSVALRCEGLTAGYARLPVVRDLDIDVAEGEVVALLGPNGAGKTTTLLTLAGVLKPIAGRVEAAGAEVRGGRPHLAARRGIVLVPADRSLLFGLTTEENVRLSLTHHKHSGGSADTVVDLFPALKSKWKVRAGLLSGGEQQMLAVGSAMACRAKVLMIDELSLGLAPIITKSILPVVRQAATELGTAVLIVEQHVDLALRVADRAYVLNHGEIHMTGPAAALLRDRDLIQASYLGEVSSEFGDAEPVHLDDAAASHTGGLP